MPTSTSAATSRASTLIDAIRANEWWEHKLAPMLGTGYMTAFLLGASLLELWSEFVLTLIAVAAAAAYVSLINDLTDLGDDRTAEKRNRLAGRSKAAAAAGLGGCMGVGAVAAALAWRDDPMALALYSGSWLSFSLYSIPPIRLKGRGAAGVLADACGAHLFPQLLIVAAVFHGQGRALDAAWMATVGMWAIAHGLRGALWHQLRDVDADLRASVRTFGRLHPLRARWLTKIAFAIELVAFGALLVRADDPLAFALLPLYVLIELARMRLWGTSIVVASGAPVFRIAMHDYYLVLYPLAFLIASSFRHPRDAIVLAAHVVLFPYALIVIGRDACRTVSQTLAARGLAR